VPPDDAGLGTSPSGIARIPERRWWQWRDGAERWSLISWLLLADSQPGVAVLWGSIELLAPARR